MPRFRKTANQARYAQGVAQRKRVLAAMSPEERKAHLLAVEGFHADQRPDDGGEEIIKGHGECGRWKHAPDD